MKILLVLLTVIGFLYRCTTSKSVAYDFPEQMLPHVKVEYEKQCDKGQYFYNLTCAKCHNLKIKGKKIIPDFNTDQLTGYSLRISNRKHTVALEDTIVNAEELGLIMTFLNYKKKSGVPLKISH
jgi:hypothetical protein